jgi:hypothetical protein
MRAVENLVLAPTGHLLLVLLVDAGSDLNSGLEPVMT